MRFVNIVRDPQRKQRKKVTQNRQQHKGPGGAFLPLYEKKP